MSRHRRTGPGGHRRAPRRRRRFAPSWKLLLGAVLGCCGAVLLALFIGYRTVGIPDENVAAQAQNNVYYWSDGSVLAKVGDYNRQNLSYDRIPASMVNAVVSAENASFWHDSGISVSGILRSVANMARGQETQSGSTITQQYVKNTYLSQRQTLSRKITELFISVKLDKERSKRDIMRGYLNTSYFGPRGYGVQAAAKGFFGKNAADLDPGQTAMLAAILKGAGEYDPSLGPKNLARCKQRRSWILDQEVRRGYLTPQQRAKYRTFPKFLRTQPDHGLGGQTGYLVRTARSYALSHAHLTDKQFDRGGFEIRTTFDRRRTAALHRAVTDELHGVLDPARRRADRDVRVGAASVKPGDGAIQALYGGPDYDRQYVNDADRQDIQVGSTFKPFVLAAALADGVSRHGAPPVPLSPASKYDGDNGYVIKDAAGAPTGYRPGNDGGESYGYLSLRRAMYHSVNTVYAQLGEDVGLARVRAAAVAAGLRPDTPAMDLHPSLSLGVAQPSAIRMADAYATFAARGLHADPYSVRLLKHDGADWPRWQAPKRTRAFPPAVADLVSDVLKGVIFDREGTGFAAQKIDRDAAGKTGTTNSNKSAWFTGYTPHLATAVGMWRERADGTRLPMYGLGSENPRQSVHGGKYPTEIWVNYMIDALGGDRAPFTPPPPRFGTVLDQPGAPSPTPTPSPSASPSGTPTPTPSPSGSPGTPAAAPSDPPDTDCGVLYWDCAATAAPTPDAPDRGASTAPSPETTTGGL